jgi:hypothetical protein
LSYSKYEVELERKKTQLDALQVYKDNDPEEITKYSKLANHHIPSCALEPS